MFQNVPMILRLLSFFNRFPHYETLQRQRQQHYVCLKCIRHTKGKRPTKPIQVFLLVGIFLPDLNRLVSHDLEKTELGLGTQNFDLAALTQLAIFVKRQENKVDFPCPVLDFWRAFLASCQTSHCRLLCSRLLNICIWKESWLDKTSRKKSKLSILISFSCCALCPSGSCVLEHLKVLTINCNLASNFYLLSPLCFLFVAV